ncbi:conserved Plasmodium protein, unknown function [Plasmodium ovale]|uniref:Uncharacterized protein n=2 Tax=Plasmodium ovale TaxID=36330 RepID=A0A1A8W677_PLAOA|nr:conserved Plasmodium protein, unknown function [Plasmodium ovale curtisi]SCP06226.1 conserved Plasmodium protein, unknown function [Plasmodium ovale]
MKLSNPKKNHRRNENIIKVIKKDKKYKFVQNGKDRRGEKEEKKKEKKDCSYSATPMRRSNRLLNKNINKSEQEKKKALTISGIKRPANDTKNGKLSSTNKKQNAYPCEKEKAPKNNKEKPRTENKKCTQKNDNDITPQNNSSKKTEIARKKKNILTKKDLSSKSENQKVNKKHIEKTNSVSRSCKKNENTTRKKNAIGKDDPGLNCKNVKRILNERSKTIKGLYHENGNDSLILLSKKEAIDNKSSFPISHRGKRKNICDRAHIEESVEKDKHTFVEGSEYIPLDEELNNKEQFKKDCNESSFKQEHFLQKKLNMRNVKYGNNYNGNKNSKKMMMMMKKIKNNQIKKSINEFIKNSTLNNSSFAPNNKYNIYSYGKGNVFYSLVRVNYNNEKTSSDNKVKLNVIEEMINIKKQKFIIGSSNRKCDLVLKGNIESEQCELICKCVQKNINHTNDINRQINKYNLFIINKSTSNTTILNDTFVDIDQIKDEDNIFLGINEINKKNYSKYIYKIKYNKMANIFNINNLCNYNKDSTSPTLANNSENGKSSKIMCNNFSLHNQNDEQESYISILIFLIMNNNYVLNEPVYYMNNLNSFTNLNTTPKKSADNTKCAKTQTSVNKMIKEDSPNTQFNESINKINKICQSRISPLCIKDSIKKEEKMRGTLKSKRDSKELPVTLLNACAELCKEKNKSTPKEMFMQGCSVSKSTPIGNTSSTPSKLGSCGFSKNAHVKMQGNNMHNIFYSNFVSCHCDAGYISCQAKGSGCDSRENDANGHKDESTDEHQVESTGEHDNNSKNEHKDESSKNEHNDESSTDVHKDESTDEHKDESTDEHKDESTDEHKDACKDKDKKDYLGDYCNSDAVDKDNLGGQHCNQSDGYSGESVDKTLKEVNVCEENTQNSNTYIHNSTGGKKNNLSITEKGKLCEHIKNVTSEYDTINERVQDGIVNVCENDEQKYSIKNCNENNAPYLPTSDLQYRNNYDDTCAEKKSKPDMDEHKVNLNLGGSLMVTPGKDDISSNSNNEMMFYDCKEEKIMDHPTCDEKKDETPLLIKTSESSEFLQNTKNGLYSLLYSKNSENNSNNDFVLCLQSEEGEGIERYLKVIGEIRVKRNTIFSDIKHYIDLKLLDKSIELTTLKKENYLKCESISQKKYSIHLNAFSDKLDETKFNEFSALHLDYIDNTNFSDLDTSEAFELKKILFIKYDE